MVISAGHPDEPSQPTKLHPLGRKRRAAATQLLLPASISTPTKLTLGRKRALYATSRLLVIKTPHTILGSNITIRPTTSISVIRIHPTLNAQDLQKARLVILTTEEIGIANTITLAGEGNSQASRD